jgi:hypothetical protein
MHIIVKVLPERDTSNSRTVQIPFTIWDDAVSIDIDGRELVFKKDDFRKLAKLLDV